MLEVMEASGLATLQDDGRAGYRRFGVPLSGPMDRIAFEAANLLASNQEGTAAIELGGGELELRAATDCVIAAAGAGYALTVNQWEFPLWGSCFVRAGWSVRLSRAGFGMWAYLAIAGGFEAPSVLGSRATYLRGRLGGIQGRTLQAGGVLKAAASPHDLMELAARSLREASRPAYTASPTIDVILGPQADRFSSEDVSRFFSGSYRVSSASDRMGYRLEGPALNGGDLTSEGMSIGSVQVPTGGQPIVMMADCATTGGYPKIACVTSLAMPLLAQCTPGQDEVRFRKVSVEEAQAAYRESIARLRKSIIKA